MLMVKATRKLTSHLHYNKSRFGGRGLAPLAASQRAQSDLDIYELSESCFPVLHMSMMRKYEVQLMSSGVEWRATTASKITICITCRGHILHMLISFTYNIRKGRKYQ